MSGDHKFSHVKELLLMNGLLLSASKSLRNSNVQFFYFLRHTGFVCARIEFIINNLDGAQGISDHQSSMTIRKRNKICMHFVSTRTPYIPTRNRIILFHFLYCAKITLVKVEGLFETFCKTYYVLHCFSHVSAISSFTRNNYY